MKLKTSKEELVEIKDRLLKLTEASGRRVYTILRHVSSSGMSRTIDVYVMVDNEPHRITGDVCKLCDYTYDDKHEGLKIGGCGMDMGFAVVYSLAHNLYKDGHPCFGEGCTSNDHFNGDRNYGPHIHRDGGYSLKQEWL